jgi:hypothetical protein
MPTRITVVIEYDDPEDVPAFSAKTKAAINGKTGKVVAVAFEDILAKEDVEK